MVMVRDIKDVDIFKADWTLELWSLIELTFDLKVLQNWAKWIPAFESMLLLDIGKSELIVKQHGQGDVRTND